jgi:hypothetical protein
MLTGDPDQVAPGRLIKRFVSTRPQGDEPHSRVQMPTDTRYVGLALPLSPTGCIDRISCKILQTFF